MNPMDLLADVFRSLQLRGEIFCRAELAEPWSLVVPPTRLWTFHLVVRGRCHLLCNGRDDELGEGDLALVAASAHEQVLSSTERARPVPLSELARTFGRARTLEISGDGERAVLVCGGFELRDVPEASLRALFPEVLVVSAGERTTLVEELWQWISEEAREDGSGAEFVLGRLAELLLVYALRRGGRPTASGPSWLRALQVPEIAAAMTRMHEQLERPWSVDELAKIAGLSRSAFASLFTETVGEPPAQHLTRWRMVHAASALARQGESVASIAERVGYQSQAAFGRGFKRHFGIPPHRYREHVLRTQDQGA